MPRRADPEHAEADWDRVMATNVRGVWLCMRAEIPRMLATGGGAIVNAASILGLVAARNSAAYCAAKHAVVRLTRAAAPDYARACIRVNAVCPGCTRTPMIDRVIDRDPEAEGRMVMAEPMGRLATPEEVAEVVLWLCPDAASFVTGHALAIDGSLPARLLRLDSGSPPRLGAGINCLVLDDNRTTPGREPSIGGFPALK